MNEEIKLKVIAKLNLEFGKDVGNLSKTEVLCKSLQEEKEKIENMLSLASSKVPSKVTAAVKDVEIVCRKIEVSGGEYESLAGTIGGRRLHIDDIITRLEDYVGRIAQLDRLFLYLRCIQAIDGLNLELEDALNEDDDERVVAEFGRLCSMCSRLHESSCAHLVTFLTDTVHYWHNTLKARYSRQFEEVLKAVHWPMVGNSVLAAGPATFGGSSPSTSASEISPRLQPLTRYLLQIEMPDELVQRPVVQSSVLPGCSSPPLALPVLLLVRPLKRRFVFHFCGNKQTNRPDKPEWFFTQVLTWIRDHEQFVDQWIQPVFNELGMPVNARVELMRGLVQLALEKLDGELPTLQFDDALFSHTVDETLGFDRELKEGFAYPDSLTSAVTILTRAQVFLRWIHMEQKYAREKMDAMLNSETAWLPFSGAEEDELKVTEVGEAFLTLLSTITDRYKGLPQPGHRLQFLDLQLELVDDLRVRLLQLLHSERDNPLDSKLPAILNTASYIATALEEWGTNTHFLMLQHYKGRLATVGEVELSVMEVAALQQGSVFDEVLQLLQRIVDELLDSLCEAVVLETKARSRPYRRDRWFAMSSPHDEVAPGVTPSACAMFQVLAAKLHQLQLVLSLPLFTAAWKKIAIQLNSFILEELILENTFNEGGADRLQLDMTRSLFPLFRQYTHHPHVYFSQVKEACALLTYRPLPSELLRGGGVKASKLALLSIQLRALTERQAVDILNRRAELAIDVM